MTHGRAFVGAAPALLLLVLAAAAVGSPEPFSRTEERARCADYASLRQPFFGDLHVHTAFSLDASTQGTRNTPRDAYRFARGEPLGIQPYDAEGRAMRHLRLRRPLDFAAVTDHAELFGERTVCETPGLPGYGSPVCFIFRRWPRLAFFLMNSRASASSQPERYSFCGPGAAACLEASLTPWTDIQAAAEEFYDRGEACSFTTFVGYEWTGAPGSNNLHRNILFRNAVVPRFPRSYFESPRVGDLNRGLRRDCVEELPGCDVLSIPHNSNLSGGLMFEDVEGEEARERAAMEPLLEVMQHKGDSECLLGGETTDEACAFEKLPYGNFAGKYVGLAAGVPLATSFVRHALRRGLEIEEESGTNPFKYGLLASTDTHLGTSGLVDEEGYPGHGGAGTPAGAEIPPGLPDDVEFNPGGLVVLWAEENSRDALFAAMRRKEVYGTSGPRFVVRFFAGWDLPEDLCDSADLVARAYGGGVPMGGDLATPAPDRAGPVFALLVHGDPDERAGLGRLEIVKIWVEKGRARERVVTVAAATAEGGVDPRTCQARGGGAARLCGVWRDPDFDPSQRALYYARVLQHPTCRWSAFLCDAAGVRCDEPATVAEGFGPCCEPRFPRTIEERAWTSPVWYSPERGS